MAIITKPELNAAAAEFAIKFNTGKLEASEELSTTIASCTQEFAQVQEQKADLQVALEELKSSKKFTREVKIKNIISTALKVLAVVLVITSIIGLFVLSTMPLSAPTTWWGMRYFGWTAARVFPKIATLATNMSIVGTVGLLSGAASKVLPVIKFGMEKAASKMEKQIKALDLEAEQTVENSTNACENMLANTNYFAAFNEANNTSNFTGEEVRATLNKAFVADMTSRVSA